MSRIPISNTHPGFEVDLAHLDRNSAIGQHPCSPTEVLVGRKYVISGLTNLKNSNVYDY